jgi:hypothetical protein
LFLHLPACPQALTGDRAGPQAAATALEEMFSGNGSGKFGKGARRPTILLIDEMDQLVNKTQVGVQAVSQCGSLSRIDRLLGAACVVGPGATRTRHQRLNQLPLLPFKSPSF